MKKRASLAVLLLILACGRGEQPALQFDRPPVILISIDTLRSDRLPAYGYDRVETPHLDAFRKDAVLFERAYAHAPLTLPSHASLFTGRLPPEHGVRSNIGYRMESGTTLASRLREHGYATGAAVSSWVLRGSTGIGSGFEFYDDEIEQRGGAAVGSLQRSGADTAARAQRWLSGQRAKPPFLFLHLFEPHTPYEPPEPFRSRYASAPYDGEIAAADAILGSFFDALKQQGIYDRALIIITSDHGEGLGDHGEDEHGIFLYREAIQVPLLVKLPGSARGNTAVARPVQLIDVMPTVLSLIAAPAAGDLPGRSLFASAVEPRAIYSETYYPRIHLGWSELRSLIEGDHHFIEAPRPELYDLRSDPAERKNLAAESRRTLFAMRDSLSAFRDSFEAPASIDPEEAARLAALGYLGSTNEGGDGPRPDPKDRIGELALMNEGVNLARDGNYREAVERLRAVLEKNPRLTDAWTHLARTYELMGDFAGAAEAYRRSIALAPSMSSDKALSLAAVYLNLNDLEQAKAHAELALAANEPAARVLLGRVALARRDLQAAAQQARAAATDPFARPGALVLLAQVALAQRQLDEAMRLADEAERAGTPPVPLVDYVRGNVYAFTGRPAEAEEAFRREIESFPQEREAYASLAVLQLLQGKGDAAEATMERLARKVPGEASLLFAAQTFAEVGDTRRAEAWRRRVSR